MGAWSWAFWIGAGLIALLGLWALVRALFADRARGRRRCPKCWYDMAGVPGLRCPECGREAKHEKKLARTRRRWWRAIGAVCLLAIAAGLAVTPRIVERGWANAVPMWALCGAAMVYDTDDHFLASVVYDQMTSQYGQATSSFDRRMMARYGLHLLRTSDRSFDMALPPPRMIYGSQFATMLLNWAGEGCAAFDADLADIVLRSSDDKARVIALRALGRLQRPRPEALSVLCDVLRTSSDWAICTQCLGVVHTHLPSSEHGVPALITVLERPWPPPSPNTPNWRSGVIGDPITIRRLALSVLERYGPAAASAKQPVIRAIELDGRLFSEALDVLLAIGPVAVDEVCALMKPFDEGALALAMQSIGAGKLKADASEACVRDLLIAHADDSAGSWAAWALGRMKAREPETIEALLTTHHKSTHLQARLNALKAIFQIDIAEPKGVEILRSAAIDKNSYVRTLAFTLIRDRIADRSQLTRELAAAEQDADPQVREIARQIRLLGDN